MSKILQKTLLKNFNIIIKRNISTTNKLCLFWERDDRGGYSTPLTDSTKFKDRMRLGLVEVKNEVKLWCTEMQDLLKADPLLMARPGETDVAWRFKTMENFDEWIVSCDSDHNEGFSYCNFEKNALGNAVFSGNINLKVPKDGRVFRAGYCNFKTKHFRKSFKREAYVDWTRYNTLVMKIRGDGRTYLLSIGSRGFFDVAWNDSYNFQLYTRGGPYWQIAKIPFSRFFLSSKGRIQDDQNALNLSRVSGFGVSAQDRHGGKFHLEIDYIGLEFDPKHTEEFSYEMYKTDKGIVAV